MLCTCTAIKNVGILLGRSLSWKSLIENPTQIFPRTHAKQSMKNQFLAWEKKQTCAKKLITFLAHDYSYIPTLIIHYVETKSPIRSNTFILKLGKQLTIVLSSCWWFTRLEEGQGDDTTPGVLLMLHNSLVFTNEIYYTLGIC